MAEKICRPLKKRYCEHAKAVVTLDAELIYPAEHLPDQPPRVEAHRCSGAVDCRLFNRGTCVWASTNPNYDPFLEKS